ncbi:MAG: methyltransferase domain-containing protein [Magnetococcales bacterium]|nr:methyltransferase domain-containing protein [Magnetococcales bacterium]
MLRSIKKAVRPLLEKIGLLTPYDEPNYRVVIFQALTRKLPNLHGKKILEIGPKDGKDTHRLASLAPESFLIMDIPSDYTLNVTSAFRTPREKLPAWFHEIACQKKTYREGNLVYLTPQEVADLGQFDLIWCTGVLYHNPEQLRFLKRLFNLLSPGGLLVLETSLTRHPQLKHYNCVEILWPKSQLCLRVGDDDNRLIPSLLAPDQGQSLSIQANVSHLPSRKAVLSWMEMCGFQNMEEVEIPILDQARMALIATKGHFMGYTYSNRGPSPSPYAIGGSL